MSASTGKMQARGLARRQAMLDAATELFLEKGFERTSLSEIVERSKGSRSTLYELFGNKEGLLRAMIEESSVRVWEIVDLESFPPSLCEEGLVQLGKRFVRAASSPVSLAIYRIIVAESRRISHIADFYFDKGPRLLKQRLVDWFRQAKPSVLTLEESARLDDVAQVFVGCVVGDFHFRFSVGLAETPTDEEIERYVRLAVHIFLSGLGRASCLAEASPGGASPEMPPGLS